MPRRSRRIKLQLKPADCQSARGKPCHALFVEALVNRSPETLIATDRCGHVFRMVLRQPDANSWVLEVAFLMWRLRMLMRDIRHVS